MENKTEPKKVSITWEAPEFIHHAKPKIWYAIFTVISIALMVFAVFSTNIIVLILFGLIILLSYIYAHRTPRIVTYKLTPEGIIQGNSIYPYKTLKSFWIIYEPPFVKTLNILTSSTLNSHVAIQLDQQDPSEVKLFLQRYLPEDTEHEETLEEILSRRLRL